MHHSVRFSGQRGIHRSDTTYTAIHTKEPGVDPACAPAHEGRGTAAGPPRAEASLPGRSAVTSCDLCDLIGWVSGLQSAPLNSRGHKVTNGSFEEIANHWEKAANAEVPNANYFLAEIDAQSHIVC